MKIAVLKETRAGETRVAASPETVKKFTGLGAEVAIETGAGWERIVLAMLILLRRLALRSPPLQRMQHKALTLF